VWITPFYSSPQNDHGYDVSDYRDVDPLFGTLEDFDSMLACAHGLGIKVIVDVVPNHTSSEHAWFKAALASEPGSLERERFVFREGRGRDGAKPPNNWQSMFGGPGWTRVEDSQGNPGQWYLNLFDATQPDLNWWNAEVGDEFESILRFWLDRGVDGFRIDVAHGLYKPFALADKVRADVLPLPMWDQPEVHEVYRRWHKVLAEYPGDRMAIAEAWVASPESMARYIRPDELQQAFNFHWLVAKWSASAFQKVISETLAAVSLVDASATWVLSNHDVVRHVTRYGGGAQGLSRAKAAVLTMLGLPGSARRGRPHRQHQRARPSVGSTPARCALRHRRRVGRHRAAIRLRSRQRAALAPSARRLGRGHGRCRRRAARLDTQLLPRGAGHPP